MNTNDTTPDWDAINKWLREPFDPALISFRPQGKPNAQGKAEILAYIDARDVQDRLDEAVGAGNWSFDWEPLRFTDKGHILLVKANLTIHGVMKSDVGEASTFSPSKGAVSDALKRAAAQWGIARYLYDLPKVYGAVDNYGHIAPALLAQLRAKLPKPGNITGRAQFDDAGEDAGENEPPRATKDAGKGASDGQRAAIRKLSAALGVQEPEVTTDTQAREEIQRLSRDYQEQTRHRETGHAPTTTEHKEPLHATLQKRLDDSEGLQDVYNDAGKYGLKGEQFFKELLRVTKLPSGALGKPLGSVPVKQIRDYVDELAKQAVEAAARTPDLATLGNGAVVP